MKSHIAIAVVLLTAALGMTGHAQDGAQKPASNTMSPTTLKMQLVLTRFQGEKKISSLPYTLSLNTDPTNRNSGRASLRLGTQVPITTMSRPSGDASAPLLPSVQYRDVGTSIDCYVVALEDGKYKVEVTVEDSSIDTARDSGANASHPAFRSFRTSDSLLLRDGQSAQYSSATDKVSGDVWKVDVTLTVVK